MDWMLALEFFMSRVPAILMAVMTTKARMASMRIPVRKGIFTFKLLNLWLLVLPIFCLPFYTVIGGVVVKSNA
jgi:hypothetical protein